MNNPGQRLALSLALLGVAVFVTSFVLGLGWSAGGGADGAAFDPETIPGARGPRIRIEVLNAAGRAGLAREATRRLRDRGFDVVYFGNASEFGADSSVVLDRAGDVEAAQAVADALGITAVRSSPDSTLLLEVTVKLGRDWPPAGRGGTGGWRARVGRIWRWIAGGGQAGSAGGG